MLNLFITDDYEWDSNVDIGTSNGQHCSWILRKI